MRWKERFFVNVGEDCGAPRTLFVCCYNLPDMVQQRKLRAAKNAWQGCKA